MLFNSLEFLVFFPVVTVLYFLLPGPRRWALLLAASCWFYAAFIPAYLLVLFALILLDYFAAIAIAGRSGAARKAVLALSLAGNVAMLGVFKYYNFLNANAGALARWLGLEYAVPDLAMALPIGLSFHTFQSMAYTIEVYRGTRPAERNLGVYALYVLFYPQLVAGPIERPGLLDQFRVVHRADASRIVEGLKLMLIGFFKKVAVADTLALTVNAVYADPWSFSAGARLAAIYFFSFQILYDFSGYSDIARGSAKVMGFDLMVNFDRPYAAGSIGEFWRRWHISLSSWFRDYLYIPLGGGRVGAARRWANVLAVFLVSGLWHGANWTFVVWGLVHGCGLVASEALSGAARALNERLGAAWRILAAAATFHFVTFAWVFFRAPSIGEALALLRGLASGYDWAAAVREVGPVLGGVSVLLILATESAGAARRSGLLRAALPEGGLLRLSASYAWAMALLGIIAARVAYGGGPQRFIYFQF